MAVYIVRDKKTIEHHFEGWNETMIWSCLQDCMGMAYSDSLESPLSAQISIGDFCFFAGAINNELIRNQPGNLHSNFAILVPKNPEWEKAIEYCHKEKVTRRMRYATKKDGNTFDKTKLRNIVSKLPLQYELRVIDDILYKEIKSLNWANDLCSNYECYEKFQSLGLGVVVLKEGVIISGASSYTSFYGGIEIEIDTREDERRQGLATVCGAALILECLKRDLYPSWDAHNKDSLSLAKRLGYSFDKEYPVYEIEF